MCMFHDLPADLFASNLITKCPVYVAICSKFSLIHFAYLFCVPNHRLVENKIVKGLQWVQDNHDDFVTILQGICCTICDSYKDIIGSPCQRFKRFETNQ